MLTFYVTENFMSQKMKYNHLQNFSSYLGINSTRGNNKTWEDIWLIREKIALIVVRKTTMMSRLLKRMKALVIAQFIKKNCYYEAYCAPSGTKLSHSLLNQ